MMISAKKIIELNKKYNLIENIAEREKNPEGAGIDLRVGEVYKLKGTCFLPIKNEHRKTPDMEKIADVKHGDKKLDLV